MATKVQDKRQEATPKAVKAASADADRRQRRIRERGNHAHDMVPVPGVGEQCRGCTARSIDT